MHKLLIINSGFIVIGKLININGFFDFKILAIFGI